MNIATALAEIVRRQALLAISSPVPATIRKVWPYFPPDSIVPETPCFMNTWSMVDARIDASLLVEHYLVQTQLFIADASRDRAAAIATAFHVAWVAAFAPHPTLSGIVSDQKVRGGSPTLAVLTRNNVEYVGLDLYMDVTLKGPISADTN